MSRTLLTFLSHLRQHMIGRLQPTTLTRRHSCRLGRDLTHKFLEYVSQNSFRHYQAAFLTAQVLVSANDHSCCYNSFGMTDAPMDTL